MLNHVTLLGRLAQTPEIKSTQSGKLVTRFDLAVPVPSTDRNAPPDYIPLTCWEKQAEFVKNYLAKGRQVVVEGRISTRKWTDNEGKTRKAVEVVATRLYFADSGNTREGDAQPTYDPAAPTFENLSNDDDLPF